MHFIVKATKSTAVPAKLQNHLKANLLFLHQVW